jgi:membrane fusion protein (multidrug efflux system)
MKLSIRIFIALSAVVMVLGALGLVKGLQIGRMVAHGKAFVPPPQTITAAEVGRATWETILTSVGSLEAVQGVTVTAELAGKVTRIAFEPGTYVEAGQFLIQQDVSQEKARLRAAQSNAQVTRKQLDRARQLHKERVIPDSNFDDRKSAYDRAAAEVDNIQAIIEKKTIRAPFSGRLGIRQVDLGEVLETGQPIVSLQTMDPIFVNFQLPQQQLDNLETGLRVRARIGTDDGSTFEGVITAINPEVDATTRNIQVQATLNNPEERLRPGMYAKVSVVLPIKQTVLVIPATAVHYTPYSDSVFVIKAQKDDSGEKQQRLKQQFVQLGEQRGDFVAVNKGLNVGQTVVSTGVFKLRNGMPVVVDNTLAPSFELMPKPGNA